MYAKLPRFRCASREHGRPWFYPTKAYPLLQALLRGFLERDGNYMKSCVDHQYGDPILPIISGIIDYTDGDHAATAILGALFVRWHKGEPLMTCASKATKEIMNMYALSHVNSTLKRMVMEGHLRVVDFTPVEIKEALTKHIRRPDFEMVFCPWCKAACNILHRHHFPIPRKSGGTEIVEICAKCHLEFHYLQDTTHFSPTDRTMDVFRSIGITKDELFNSYGRPV